MFACCWPAGYCCAPTPRGQGQNWRDTAAVAPVWCQWSLAPADGHNLSCTPARSQHHHRLSSGELGTQTSDTMGSPDVQPWQLLVVIFNSYSLHCKRSQSVKISLQCPQVLSCYISVCRTGDPVSIPDPITGHWGAG